MNELNLTHEKLPKSVLHRLGTLVLALCMTLSLLPGVLPPADAAFSDAAMDKLLNWGVVTGYPDGALHPESPLTRAEFVAMVNRAYGYNELGVTPFIDVPNNAWYRDDINIAYNANYFSGVSPRMAAPGSQLTREQAMVLLARNMRMEPVDGEVTEFTDGRDFSDWSRGYARAAKEAGVIGGYGDGSYKPKNTITRGEMAVMLQRALGTLINKPGTHTLSDVYGNVTISSPNVILRNSTIAGDLYITGGLSLGDVTLENVRVLGKIIIAGGGESQSGESVILRNVQADELIVDSIAGQYVSLASEGDTLIGEAILRTSAYVQDRTRPGEGLLQITLDSLEAAAAFTLSGNLETVVNKTPNSTLNIAMGTVDVLTIDEEARSSLLHLDINSTVKQLNLDTATVVTGVGDIGDLFVNAPGVSVEMLPDRVTIRPGLTADIAGQTMNAQQAQESSADPRLNAGYPKVRNIAPTNASSTYSANKGGTVYWAVSNTVDGSIGEEELIEPTTDNTRIVLNGSTPVELSNTEYTAALEKLSPDSNYYLSTIMVDARGRRSPVKVASFVTPDNTVPAFSQGYPTVMKNYCESRKGVVAGVSGVVLRDEEGNPQRNYRVQIAAMPNKSCVLYYAVYPAGSIAPTAQQFRTGALGTPIRSGVEDATKNRINFVELTGLEELTNYDIYLCYIDADGSRSSPVRKLTFRTVDGKPPRFQYETPVVTQEQLTGLRLSANVSENATIYWVATKDANYVKDGDWSDTEWWERACRQIESGTNGIRSGSVAARANADVAINITGLQPATRYYIFFVAKDAAGNYSEFFRAAGVTDSGIIINPGDDPDIDPPQQYTPHNKQPYVYYLKASTLDNIPPTATQEFTHYDTADETRPYADTDIQIHFSEAVMQYSTHRNAAPDAFNDFEMLYNAHLKARKAYDDAVAAGVTGTELADLYNAWSNSGFVNALRATIKLYNNASIVNDPVTERTAANEASVGDDWVIDYRWAEVTSDADTGEMTVIFPTNSEDSTRSALNLSSGATYHFVLDDICDTSSNKNRMGRTQLPDFTTISAQVNLNTINVTRVNYYNPETGELEKEIPIDMAFSMTPVSTSVEADVDWDILFWSDTSVGFEVYEINENHNDSDAVAIRPLVGGHFPEAMGHYSVPLDIGTIEAPDPDPTADNYRGYLGRSYFNHFYGVRGTFPSVTGKGNVLADYSVDEDVNLRGIMERNEPKFYGIHITSIGDTDEEHGRNKTWDATIKFRISVVASNSTNLGNLATDISNATITAFDGNPQDGGSVIHSPRPFTMTKRFANLAAPEFDADYPMFDATDTSVTMTLRLDRPGTGYYVIAPASAWVQGTNNSPPYKTYIPDISTYVLDGTPTGTRISPPSNTTDSTNAETYERYYGVVKDARRNVPFNGSTLTFPAYNPETNDFDTTKMTSKFLLTAPTVRTIYTGTDPNSSGISGKWEQTGVTSVIEPVSGLEPETVYFVYFVLQGVGQVYSDYVQLFQFTTKPLSRPYLSVENNNKNATIASTNMPATVDTGLFLLDAAAANQTLGRKLKDVLDPLVDASIWADYSQRDNIDTGKTHEEDTVWQALCAPFEDQGSYFDRFANETIKDAVASLIRTSTGATDRLGGELGVAQDRYEKHPYSFPDIMQKDMPYLLLAVARGRDGASGHALGFIGARLIIQDTDPPSISQVGGAVTVDYKKGKSGPGGFKMTGYITLTFDRPLWLLDTNVMPYDRTPLTGSMLPDYFIDRDISADKPFAAQSSSSTSAVSVVRVNLAELKDDGTGGVQQDEDFTANMWLCAERSGTRHLLTIQIHFDAATQKVTAIVTSDSEIPTADKWFPDTSKCNITTTVVAPDPSDFTLSTQNLRLNFGDSANIIAYLSPTGAKGKVRFTWKGTPVADIETISDTEIRVSAVNSVSETVSGTIVATLCYEDGTTVTRDGQPVTLEIAVTIATKEVAYIRVIPPASERVNLSVSKGIRIVQFDIEVVDPNNLLSDDDKIISRSVDNNGASSTTLICTVEPTLGRPGRGTVTVMTAEGATPPTIVTFTIKAANPALITSLNIQVNLPD